MEPDPGRASTTGSWLARVVGALLLTEQSAAHLWGLPTSMIIVGVGVFLLSGKEGAEFVLWLLGRGGPPGGRGPGPP